MPGLDAVGGADREVGLCRLQQFRLLVYASCLPARADALIELADAVLTWPGPVSSLVELCMAAAFRRGWQSLYDALSAGRADVAGVRRALAGALDVPAGSPVVMAVDVSPWPRPEAPTCPDRRYMHVKCACLRKGAAVPGYPYQVAAAVGFGRGSWCAPLSAVRLEPGADATAVTVAQVGAGVADLCEAGKVGWDGPVPVVVLDSGYDGTRIAYGAAEAAVRVQVLVRVRSHRVFYADPDLDAWRSRGRGAAPRHGERLALNTAEADLPDPDEWLQDVSERYGRVDVRAFAGRHQMLAGRRAWAGHGGPLPVVPGTLIRVQVERLPGVAVPKPLWLWHHAPADVPFDLDLLWQAYMRRFDIEHMFRMWKQTLGWTAPRLRTPAQHDLWTVLIMFVYTQLRLGRSLVGDTARPWDPGRRDRAPTPGAVRRGFAALLPELGTPAAPPRASAPRPGRPRGKAAAPRERFPIKRATPKKSRKPAKKSQLTQAA